MIQNLKQPLRIQNTAFADLLHFKDVTMLSPMRSGQVTDRTSLGVDCSESKSYESGCEDGNESGS